MSDVNLPRGLPSAVGDQLVGGVAILDHVDRFVAALGSAAFVVRGEKGRHLAAHPSELGLSPAHLHLVVEEQLRESGLRSHGVALALVIG